MAPLYDPKDRSPKRPSSVRHPCPPSEHFWAEPQCPPFLRRGETFSDLGYLGEALADLDAALALEPGFVEALLRRSEVHADLGHYAQALADVNRALNLQPGDAEILARRGEIHRRMGRYRQAIADLDAALRIDPLDAWAAASRGETYREMGLYDLALADLTMAVRIDPNDTWAIVSPGRSTGAGALRRGRRRLWTTLGSGCLLQRRAEAYAARALEDARRRPGPGPGASQRTSGPLPARRDPGAGWAPDEARLTGHAAVTRTTPGLWAGPGCWPSWHTRPRR